MQIVRASLKIARACCCWPANLGYQTRSFAESARRLGVDVVIGSDRCHQLDDPWSDGAIALHFEEPEQAAATAGRSRASEAGARDPRAGRSADGDRGVCGARRWACVTTRLSRWRIAAASCGSAKCCARAELPVPDFFSFPLRASASPRCLPRVSFPCVVKPLRLSASQGVIRANDAAEFTAAVERIAQLLASPEVQVTREAELDRLLVERYIPGAEVALEGLLEDGQLRVLALFDKPDPLEGPYFEESIYVTPSRLPAGDAGARSSSARRETARALGLVGGPDPCRISRERRWALGAGDCAAAHWRALFARRCDLARSGFFWRSCWCGTPWVFHARIGGRGDRARAVGGGSDDDSGAASGVLEGVEGVERRPLRRRAWMKSKSPRGLHDFIAAWPEGSSYLGFIFARAETPAEVESALAAGAFGTAFHDYAAAAGGASGSGRTLP